MQLAHKTAALWGLEKILFFSSWKKSPAQGWLGKAAVPRVAGSASETPTPPPGAAESRGVGARAAVLTQAEARFHFLVAETRPSTRTRRSLRLSAGKQRGRAGRWAMRDPRFATENLVLTDPTSGFRFQLPTRPETAACRFFLEKGMAAHSSIFACRIPWTEKPGRLQSMGSQRVGHD